MKMKNTKITLITLFAVLFAMGCTKRSSTVPQVELTQDMMVDPSVKAQDFDPEMIGKRANRLPPEGTIPQGDWTPYPNYPTDEAAKNNPNPVKLNTEILAKGDRKYQIYCGVCHGTKGDGQSLLYDVMLVKPPSLIGAKIRGWTDGQIFHLATKGRGLMKGYEAQIPNAEDRWAIVHYIRHLQKNQKVNEGPAAGTPATGN